MRRIATRTRFVLLRHASELMRPTNSGRWAALALENAQVVDYAVPGDPADLSPLASPGTVVLFPSPHGSILDPLPRQVVVLDATWAQARRMIQRIPALRTLPRLALPVRALAAHSRPMRRPTVQGGLSTIEAIAAALELLGERDPARALHDLHRSALARGWRLRAGGAFGVDNALRRAHAKRGGDTMPVSKKRKKGGKPVQRHAVPGEKHEAEHPEGHSGPPPLKTGKPRNPFVGQQPQHRGAQRGR